MNVIGGRWGLEGGDDRKDGSWLWSGVHGCGSGSSGAGRGPHRVQGVAFIDMYRHA